MTAYAFWNNKGGVGKSFLAFIASTEYAHLHPETDVYVIDLCPQGNLSETLLGGFDPDAKALLALTDAKPRCTVAGYLEERLNSPFKMIDDIGPYLSHPCKYNSKIPENLWLVCGDNLLEILSEAIRQTSQLAVPFDAWGKVVSWISDLCKALKKRSGQRETMFAIDCNPSFAVYTQLGLAAAESVIVPFTADDSSRRGIENVIALLYGVGDKHTETYAKISFAKKALEEGIQQPKLHTFVSNRVTLWDGQPSKAFRVVSDRIKETVDRIHRKHRSFYAMPKESPSSAFVQIPDYHGACVYCAATGTPIFSLKPGPKSFDGERVQLNKEPLDRYKSALGTFVERL
ncbi:ParA family protein [Gluconobacter sp. R75690]|uniref:ParA family protein n=1 Tax=unclassified Gluconobacter TaxID=2644261 RepID=UPI00188D611E|nr:MULTISPECIES: ParA family protein [unclassified Gluconobacter]MBF0849798.1 ParA family protein [Gluconobacter sp. R75690]MBF0878755.1 ParA family protein [Gluconobacter sp. R75828]